MTIAATMRIQLVAGRIGAALILALPAAASAATFGELNSGMQGNGAVQQGYAAGPYASAPSLPCLPQCAMAAPRLYGWLLYTSPGPRD